VLLAAAVLAAVPVAGWSQIDEIVVTTRKKEENIQDVPIAVSAITADQIQREGVADLADVAKSDPSVQFDRSFGPSDTRITIRGLSNTRGRSNVAFLVDNIDVTTENLIVAGSGLLANRRLLTDVQRIEIVKGPQSALYGRAAFAGAINYITKEPGDVFDATGRVDFAQDGFQQFDGALGGPIGDNLGFRLTGFWYNQDGHYVNQMSGDDVGGSSGSGAAITFVARPNDALKIKARSEFSKEDYDPLANVRVGGGSQSGSSIKLHEFPQAVLDHAVNRLTGLSNLNGLGATTSVDSTGLLDFWQYCPSGLQNAAQGPGICLPTNFGSAKGRVVKHSENPLTGDDFDGTDLQTFRFSLIATVEADFGTFTSYSGITNFDARDNYDQDWQAEADYKYTPFVWEPLYGPAQPVLSIPDTPSPDFYNGRRADQLTSGQIANTQSEVNQMSQEFRYASKFDGPLNFTVGALFWDEVRELRDRNGIFACMPLDKVTALAYDPDTGEFTPSLIVYQDSDLGNGGSLSGNVCDGGLGPTGFPTVIGWQEFYRQVQPQAASYWQADTRHWSFYAKLAWQINDDWSLEIEDRYVSESFRLEKPNQSTCTNLGFIGVIGQSFREEEEGEFDAICPYQRIITPTAEQPDGQLLSANDTIRPLQATQSSHYSTPKVTLKWQWAPDNNVYFFWAKGQKPGGINQLAGGGSAVFVETEAFLPEKLQAWELGSKNTFELGGLLQLNGALFFQDYTDKQTNTQVVDATGTSQPRTLNASGAEIWGGELSAIWEPAFLEGLAFSLSYTYLDATYTDFVDDITSLQRIAYTADKNCQLIYKNAAGDEFTTPITNGVSVACRTDLGGNQLERTPEHALSLGASLRRPLLDSGLDFLGELDANWTDKRYLDQDNGTYFDSYWNLDLRVGLVHPQYEFIAYVDNLLDDDTIRSGGSGPDFARQVAETGFTAGLGVSHFFGTLPDPRIVGIRANYKFGGE
jgi:outer membrane receptor protein involved in Fe transport